MRAAFLQGLREGLRGGLPSQLGTATVANGLVENLSAAFSPLVPGGASAEEEDPLLLLAWKVMPDYFDVLDLPLRQGRGFLEDEAVGEEKVAVVNDRIARRYFPGGDAVGRQININAEWYRIVGVAASVDLPALSGGTLGEFQLFLPLQQRVGTGFTIIARTGADRAAAVERIKEIVWGLDRSLPIMDVSLVQDALAKSLSEERSNALLMVIFALTALILGAVGIYGVVAYSVSRKVREMGIRLALGASARRVVGRVVLGGLGTVGIGMAVGAVGAFALGSTLSGLLVEVDPRDPGVFLLVAGVTLVVALGATWLPARRAAGASPVDALRSD